MNLKKNEWLKKELDQWVYNGLISSEQRDAIQACYSEEKSGSLTLTLFSIVGAVLVGAGIILIFATNWWRLPLEVRLFFALLPLLVAQILCFFTFTKRYYSAAFREGGAVFLSLSFFAAIALIGQVFHLPGQLDSYLLVCSLCIIPAVYFFQSRATLTIYIASTGVCVWFLPLGTVLLLTALCLPFFYRECTRSQSTDGLNYLLLLLSIMVCNTLIVVGKVQLNFQEMTLLCCLLLLILDGLFRRISAVYFFTSAKMLAILGFTVILLCFAWELDFRYHLYYLLSILGATLTAIYFFIRFRRPFVCNSGDLFVLSILIVLLSREYVKVVSSVLALVIGIFYMARGSAALQLSKSNYGMVLIMVLVLLYFFDSNLGLLGRGILFVSLGFIFLSINLFIIKKRNGKKT